ncbi:hypothetical protein N7447_007618 [Penicillium robsamsonii]|uniref:uncharacterized protein n=1 Tax=Penicillium robsamsonii TaxID=1792511 RepID=UPI002549820A|nr:uncharacterized protein N7447_007618 [Penicillium robsamsonii]KAJ5817610.1 hypothetical protein N7447_007618 [Penicillium robsamsonii]
MSQVRQQEVRDEESEEQTQLQRPPNPTGSCNLAKLAQTAPAPQECQGKVVPAPLPGGRISPFCESWVKDRRANVSEEDSSLNIKIELDLEVEVELYA